MQLKIMQKKLLSKTLLVLVMLLFTISSSAQTYEFETGTLINDASVENCVSCSGKIVGNLGLDSSVSTPVSVAAAGWYNLQLFYCTADSRTIRLTAGSSSAIAIPCEPSGGWGVAASKYIKIYLNAGVTTMLWENAVSWAPNLDKFILTPASSSSQQTISFGGGNSVVYDLSDKTYNVNYGGTTVIRNASAYAISDQKYLSSNFALAVYSSEPFSDNIGSGTKHIFTLSGNYALGMQQIFYTYNNKEYVVVQVVLTGTGSSCNKMSPLTSNYVTPNFGSGDTRALFVPYDNDEWVRYKAYLLSYANFTASEVTNIYNNDTRKGLVIGSVEHTKWKTGVSVYGGGTSSAYVSVIAGWTDPAITHDGRGHGWVNVGQTSCASPKVMINANGDWRTALEEFGQANAALQPKYVFDWTAPKPMGWNSWEAFKTTINYAKSTSVVDFFYNDCPAYRSKDNTLFIDLDSYWDNMTDAELAQFVVYAKSKGFKAGIYWAPLVDWGMWDRRIEGSSYNYSAIWTKINGLPFKRSGAYAIDPTHPGTKDRMKYFINRFKAAGFEMVKIDFLTHGSLEADSFYNTSIHTGMEAYQEGMRFLIDEIGNTMLVEAAICPNLSTGPYAHMRRIACDSYQKGNIVDTEYQLNSATYGWWQNQMYDYLDSDGVVFANTSIGENRARLLSSVVIGTITTADDYSVATAKAKSISLLQNKDVMDVARAEVNFIPADGNTDNYASEVFYTTQKGTNYVAVFNYSSTTKTYNLDLSRFGLAAGKYKVKELYSGISSNAQGSLNIVLPAKDASLYAITDDTGLGVSDQTRNLETNYIFPNPTSTSFRIKFTNAVNGTVKFFMYDLIGKEIWKTTSNVNGFISPEISVNNLANGTYVLKVSTPENSVQSYKFIKQ